MTEFLARSGSVTLDASGSGALSFSPGKYGETWTITKFTTDGNSAIKPELEIHRGSVSGDIIDSSNNGNQDVSETDVTVKWGDSVTALYLGGSPGSVMQFYLEGTIERGIS